MGGPLITYIFTDEAGQVSLYYDIELQQPLPGTETGGALFPTTTILTKKRILFPFRGTWRLPFASLVRTKSSTAL